MILKTKSKEYEKWRVTIVLYWGAFLLFFAFKLRQGHKKNFLLHTPNGEYIGGIVNIIAD